jgi:hypothetical protein
MEWLPNNGRLTHSPCNIGIDVDFPLISLYHVNVHVISDVSELPNASTYVVEMSPVDDYKMLYGLAIHQLHGNF